MPSLTFIFGPNNTFFFDSPKSWKFHNIPPTLRQLFNASMSPQWRIQQPYILALGPQLEGLAEPLYYTGCKTCDGSDKIFYSQTHFELYYPDLSSWIKTVPNSPKACYVTFGPGLSYFGSAPGGGSIWAGIPTDLRDKIQKAFDTPNLVSLGLNNAWFVMWPDGYFSWKFYGNYEALDKILTAAEPRSVEYLAINPYDKNQYFVVFKDKTIKYSLSNEWMPQMQEVFNEWQNELMKSRLAPPAQPVQVDVKHRYSVASLAPQPPQPQFQQPPIPRQPQWNPNYPPSPEAPQYLSPATPANRLSNYSTPLTPPFSPVSPYPSQAFELYAPMPLQPQGQVQPQPQRPMSIQPVPAPMETKEKSRFWKRRSKVIAPAAVPTATHGAGNPTKEGSETCTTM